MEVADCIAQIRQRYLDHDRACCTQSLISAAGAVLITEGFVFDGPCSQEWRVFVPPGRVKQLLKQGLVATNKSK